MPDGQPKYKVSLLFSNPLVYKRRVDGKDEVQEKVFADLNYQAEFRWTNHNSFNKDILYEKMCATMENFSLLSSHPNPPTVLHFSGHGFECNKEYEYLQNNLFNFNGNLLVFEDENCQANYVPQTWISGHIKSSNMLQQLQLVVILSCHSEAIGKVFFEAGVKHVICIRQNQEVSDDVSNMFANQFYGLLFKGDLSICQIYYKTLLNMENHPDNEIQKEAKKFIMFRQTDYPYDTEEYKTGTEKQKKKIALAFYQKMRTFDYNTCKCSKLKPNGNLRSEYQEQM